MAVCQALAARSPALDARFALGSIEEIIPQLGEDGFDLVLGLSVFHHLCNERGQEFVRDLLGLLLARVPNALFELALAAEPPAWARALPDDPAALLTRIPFARVLSRHPTHLSSLERPLYFCSRSHWLLSGLGRFERWARGPHRRVYAQGRSLAKVYEDLPAEALALEREAAYLESSSSGLPARPRLEESGHGDGMRWLRVEFPPGESVTEWIRQRRAYDEALLLRQLVRQLAAWEASELYDPGLRAAHLWVSADGLLVTDNGSLIAGREHLPASATPFLNFWITVHELCNRVEVPPESVDPRFYVHTGLPKPWSEWAKQFWARPQNEWSFRFLLETLPQGGTGPGKASTLRRREELLAPLGYTVRYRMQPKYRGAPHAELCLAAKDGQEYVAVLDPGHFARLRSVQHKIPHTVPIAAQVEECFLFPRVSGRLLWECDTAPDPAGIEPQLLAFAEATRRLGLIHGDLRPWNIFFDPERGIEVIDWGHGGFVDELRLGSFALGHLQATLHGECHITELASIDLEDARRLLRLLRGEIGLRQAWGLDRMPGAPPWCRP